MKRIVIFLINFMIIGIAMSNNAGEIFSKEKKKDCSAYIKISDTVRSIVNHPELKNFAQYMLPWDNNTNYYDTPMSNVSSIMPYHSHVNHDLVVGAINHMIDEVCKGKRIFYNFYTEEQKQKDPSKSYAGLFFFRGKQGAPFAVVCPGGGFSYVGSLHEGFPYALELSKKGYNAFVLRYRIGSNFWATEDLAAAISLIFRNAETLGVGIEHYSLWGSSAGARMVGDIALNAPGGYGNYDLPKPAVVVIAYTGQSSYSPNYPPTYIMVSEDDRIVDVSVVDRRVKNLRNAGIEVEYHKYKNAGHGFGIGTGTDAEGWMKYAIQFWEKYISKKSKK